jgi:enediyne biosynthesis protein E4
MKAGARLLVAVSGVLLLLSGTPFAVTAPTAPKRQTSWYTDVAPRSHFSYRTNNDFESRKYFPQPMCGGVAVLDYDNDGKMDIFFTNGAKLPEMEKTDSKYYGCLLRNRGDGTFEDVTAKAGLTGAGLGYSFGVAAGDYDNDGKEDLFVCSAGRNTLYHNNGDGTFSDVTLASGFAAKAPDLLSVGAAWLDYDNDGLLDLMVTNYTTWNPQSDHRCVMNNTTDVYCSPKLYQSVASTLYHNLGHGKFQDVTASSGIGTARGKGMGISIADFNGDGWMDVFVANDTERNFLFMNQGDGTFKEQGLLYGVAYNEAGATVSGMGSDAKDFNNDGWVDVVFNDLAGEVYGLFQNNQGHSFDYVSTRAGIERLTSLLSGWSIGFIDYNNDGWKDLYSANGSVDNITAGSKQKDSMLKNVNGKFADAGEEMGRDFSIVGYQRGSAFTDLNNDGFQDIVVTSLGERPRILMNNALNSNHWILFDLQGTQSNRDGIGARIKLVMASGRTLYNHATTSVGFMSSSDRRVHFGLGTEKSIREAEIRWPSGVVQILPHPDVDRVLRVEEPARAIAPRP